MSIENSNINVAIDAETAEFLAYIARKKHKSVESLARDHIMEALEHREDMFLSALTEELDTPDAKQINHVL